MGLTTTRGLMSTPAVETPQETKHPASQTGCFRCLGKDLNLGPAD